MFYYFQALMLVAFKNHPFSKIINIHQSVKGWVGVIKDEMTGQEYYFHAYPIKSEKVISPETVDQLLDMNQGGSNG